MSDEPHLDDTTLVLLDMLGPATGLPPKRLRHRLADLNLALLDEPHAVFRFSRWSFDVEFSLFHWLKHSLDYDSDGDRAMHVLKRWARKIGADVSGLHDWTQFYPAFACAVDRRDPCKTCDGTGQIMVELGPVLLADDGDKVEIDDVDVEEECPNCRGSGWTRPRIIFDKDPYDALSTRHSQLPDDYRLAGLHGDGDARFETTDGVDHLLETGFQFVYAEPQWRSRDEVVAIAMGGTVRVFTTSNDLSIFDYGRGSIVCSNEGPFVTEVRKAFGNEEVHRWETDNASSWRRAEDYAPRGAKSLDRHALVDLTAEGEVDNWSPGSLYFTSEETEINGVRYPKNTGFCPECGGILKAWFF